MRLIQVPKSDYVEFILEHEEETKELFSENHAIMQSINGSGEIVAQAVYRPLLPATYQIAGND